MTETPKTVNFVCSRHDHRPKPRHAHGAGQSWAFEHEHGVAENGWTYGFNFRPLGLVARGAGASSQVGAAVPLRPPGAVSHVVDVGPSAKQGMEAASVLVDQGLRGVRVSEVHGTHLTDDQRSQE